MRKVGIFIALALLLAFSASPVYANGEVPPQLPHAFYGSVTVNGDAASAGTQVSATVAGGEVITNVQNPTTTAGGSYGVGDSPYLLVQGNITPGATITFHVTNEDGTAIADVTATFEVGGGPTLKNLSVTIEPEPGPGPGPAPGAPTYYTDTNLFGTETRFRISSAGKILETIEATSEDGMLTITIPKDTIALDEDGNRLASLEAAVDETPPDPPEDAYIIGLAYDFGPDGATFDPAISLTWSYDPDALPEGVAEADLVLAYYDEATGEWVEIDCVVDTENNLITASVAHFTTFAIIGSVPEEEPVGEEEEEEEEEVTPAAFSVSYLSVSPRLEVEPGETVAITVLVANTGGESGSYTVVLKIDGVKEAEETVTIAAGESQEVSFSVSREEADTYTVAVDGLSGSFTVVAPPVGEEEEEEVPTKPGINWALIGGIIGGVVIVAGLLYYFLVFRRRAY